MFHCCVCNPIGQRMMHHHVQPCISQRRGSMEEMVLARETKGSQVANLHNALLV